MRIRTRLTLWYSAILLGILLVIGALSYSVLRWRLMPDLDSSLMTVAQVVHDTRAAMRTIRTWRRSCAYARAGIVRAVRPALDPTAGRARGPPSLAASACRLGPGAGEMRAAASRPSRRSRTTANRWDPDDADPRARPGCPDRPGRQLAQPSPGRAAPLSRDARLLIRSGSGLRPRGLRHRGEGAPPGG